MKINYYLSNAILVLLLSSCSSFNIIKKPVTFDQQRTQLSLQYLKERHGIETDQLNIDPKMIVVHYTVAPTLESTMDIFQNSQLASSRTQITGASSLNVSAQFVVDRDGTVYQILPDETTFARHVIGLNYCALGIENVGDAKDNPLTAAQLQANIDLITYLKKKYDGIEYLIGHQEYNLFRSHALWKETDPNYRTEKSDPGEQFMKKLRNNLTALDLNGPPK